jgi:coatomer subunit beta'
VGSSFDVMLIGTERAAEEKGQNNLAFATHFQLGDAAACVDLLVNTQRAPEAALFARTYAPRYVSFYTALSMLIPMHNRTMIFSSQASKAVDAWKADLTSKKRPKIAASVTHPDVNPDLFEEGWEQALAGKLGSLISSLKVIDNLTSGSKFTDENKAAVGR